MTTSDGAPKTSNINVRRGDPLVEIADVQKHYGDFQALKDINLTVNRGERLPVRNRLRAARRWLTGSFHPCYRSVKGAVRPWQSVADGP